MNLKLIDAAIKAYRGNLDAGDETRLTFFRKLWAISDACAGEGRSRAAADAYVLLPEDDLASAYRGERPILGDCPAAIDEAALADASARLAAKLVAEGGFGDEIARVLGNVKWDHAIAESDLSLAGADPSAWLADLAATLVDDGMDESCAHLAALVASMALKIQLEPIAEAVMKAVKKAELEGTHPLMCPVCGSAPMMAHVGGRTSSAGRGKLLVCGQCGATWEFDRVRCARCGTRNQAHLHYFNIEGDDAHRIATCDECGGYIRTLYSEEGSLLPCSYEVEDVVMARLDAIAQNPHFAGGATQ